MSRKQMDYRKAKIDHHANCLNCGGMIKPGQSRRKQVQRDTTKTFRNARGFNQRPISHYDRNDPKQVVEGFYHQNQKDCDDVIQARNCYVPAGIPLRMGPGGVPRPRILGRKTLNQMPDFLRKIYEEGKKELAVSAAVTVE
jgi:hypothetical protein